MLTFALGGLVTGLAAALITPLFTVYPTMGSLLTLKALVAIVMGGMGGPPFFVFLFCAHTYIYSFQKHF
jgi:branched-subunit amino acid ABC-type transport system permease component